LCYRIFYVSGSSCAGLIHFKNQTGTVSWLIVWKLHSYTHLLITHLPILCHGGTQVCKLTLLTAHTTLSTYHTQANQTVEMNQNKNKKAHNTVNNATSVKH